MCGNEGGEKENKNVSEEIRWKTPAEKHAMTNKWRQTVKKNVAEKHTPCIVWWNCISESQEAVTAFSPNKSYF